MIYNINNCFCVVNCRGNFLVFPLIFTYILQSRSENKILIKL